MSRQQPFDDRHIEYDALAFVMLGLLFVAASAVATAVIGSAAQGIGPAVVAAGMGVGAAVITAWVFGYPRHAACPSIALALMLAAVVVPRLIRLDGVLLAEAADAPAARVQVIAGLYVGGLALLLLAFLVVGFIAPFIGALLRLRRGEPGARGTVRLHVLLFAAACVLTGATAVWL
jgi:hypothetical protein